jgi:predicted Rossmann fold nucleotide-binding protein DprA/Smf involved in DNA uptake
MNTGTKRGLNEILRDEMVVRDKIIAVLREEPKTIPEIAETLGFPSHEVLLWVMSMWRYGEVRELEKSRAEDYFRYALKNAHH